MGNDEKQIVEKLTKELKQVEDSEGLKKCLKGLSGINKNRSKMSKFKNFFWEGALAS